MMSTLQRLQDWYKINCDGDWEHDQGLSITTLDNPGWYLVLNLESTALENLQFTNQFQNEADENDWHHFKVENKNLIIACGPSKLEEALLIFSDKIIPEFSDPKIIYDVYLPLSGLNYKVWYLAKGKLISENILELTEVPVVEYKNIMVQNLDLLDFSEEDMPAFKSSYVIGQCIKITLEQMFDGVKLVAIEQ